MEDSRHTMSVILRDRYMSSIKVSDDKLIKDHKKEKYLLVHKGTYIYN